MLVKQSALADGLLRRHCGRPQLFSRWRNLPAYHRADIGLEQMKYMKVKVLLPQNRQWRPVGAVEAQLCTLLLTLVLDGGGWLYPAGK